LCIVPAVLRGLASARLALGVALVTAAVLVVAGLASGSRTASTATSITVTVTDTGAKFSKTTIPPGKVTFAVTNKGKKPHYFAINGHSSGTLAPGKKGKVVVTLTPGTTQWFISNPLKGGKVKVAAASTGSAGGSVAAGKTVFESAGCKSCHTLKAAGATGTIGPNLDQIKPGVATVVSFVTNGYNGVGAAVPMPSFKGQLSTTQIKDVAAFVYASTH
jgi:mono/diheme cytochrome c family protein